MKPAVDIQERMLYIQNKITLLQTLKQQEMNKNFVSRDYKFLQFIWKEECVYAYAMQQFKWLIDNESDLLCGGKI